MHVPATHHDHDPLLIAALVDGDSDAPVTDERARRLIAECADCATLHADLIALAAASRALPAPAIRTRDFRLSAADAARLRPSGWRRVIVAFGSPRDGLTRPLAAGLTTLGLAGLLIGTLPSGFFFAASGAAPEQKRDLVTVGEGTPTAAPAPVAPAAGVEGLGTHDTQGVAPTNKVDQEYGDDGVRTTSMELADDRSGLSTFVVLSGSLLIIGLGLFALRWTARRFGS
jgi:anti-sigma factor RsiW